MIGKIIGSLLGYMLLRLPGLLLGLYLGNRYDKAQKNKKSGYSFSGWSWGKHPYKQEEFFRAAFSVMGHVAKAKGNVTQEEILVASDTMNRMGLNTEQRIAAQNAFRSGKENNFPLEEALANLKTSTNGNYRLLQFFLELQISAAFADGALHPNERDVLHKISAALGFSASQLEHRLQMQEALFRFQRQGSFYSQNNHSYANSSVNYAEQLKNAYSVLGIDENSDRKTVKRTYHKLMNEYHPDKLMAKGLPPEMMNVAKEKAQAIQNAYDLIKKDQGFK